MIKSNILLLLLLAPEFFPARSDILSTSATKPSLVNLFQVLFSNELKEGNVGVFNADSDLAKDLLTGVFPNVSTQFQFLVTSWQSVQLEYKGYGIKDLDFMIIFVDNIEEVTK